MKKTELKKDDTPRLIQIQKKNKKKKNVSAALVGKIFAEAGAAFNKLAEMTMLLHPLPEAPSSTHTKISTKKKPLEDKSPSSSNNTPVKVTTIVKNSQVSEDAESISNNVKMETESSDCKKSAVAETKEIKEEE